MCRISLGFSDHYVADRISAMCTSYPLSCAMTGVWEWEKIGGVWRDLNGFLDSLITRGLSYLLQVHFNVFLQS